MAYTLAGRLLRSGILAALLLSAVGCCGAMTEDVRVDWNQAVRPSDSSVVRTLQFADLPGPHHAPEQARLKETRVPMFTYWVRGAQFGAFADHSHVQVLFYAPSDRGQAWDITRIMFPTDTEASGEASLSVLPAWPWSVGVWLAATLERTPAALLAMREHQDPLCRSAGVEVSHEGLANGQLRFDGIMYGWATFTGTLRFDEKDLSRLGQTPSSRGTIPTKRGGGAE